MKYVDKLTNKADGVGMPSWNYLTTSIAGVLFLASTLSLLGQTTLTALGVDFSGFLASTWFSLGPLPIMWGSVVSLLAIGAVYSGSSRDFTDFSSHQTQLAMLTFIGVVAMTISPPLTEYLGSSTGLAAFTVLLLTFGWASMIETGGGQ
jgi:FtsH-binding integral membrane protein